MDELIGKTIDAMGKIIKSILDFIFDVADSVMDLFFENMGFCIGCIIMCVIIGILAITLLSNDTKELPSKSETGYYEESSKYSDSSDDFDYTIEEIDKEIKEKEKEEKEEEKEKVMVEEEPKPEMNYIYYRIETKEKVYHCENYEYKDGNIHIYRLIDYTNEKLYNTEYIILKEELVTSISKEKAVSLESLRKKECFIGTIF